MKLNRTFIAFFCLSVFFVACQKEASLDTGKQPQPPAPIDTTTQTTPLPDTTQTLPEPVSIIIQNPGFESGLKFWKKETAYTGRYGFTASKDAVRTGSLGLNFYASQKTHWVGAPQETPWNGKIYQTVQGLEDGRYTFQVYADAVGSGMYLWADGGNGEVKVLINSESNELNTLDFEVKGGVAMFGFICIDANGPEKYAPYFHADDAELLRN